MAVHIERLDFSPWGCFEDVSIPFAVTPGKVNLLYGLNAAGKSTTSRGQRSLLYGMEARTPDNHTYDYADLRIGARLQLDGATVELARRKRRVGSLVGPDGEPLTDDVIAAALSGLSEEIYRSLFQIDHETLVQGGAELLAGRGEVGASLFAAAAGIATLHGTLSDIDGRANRLYNPRGRASELHKALAAMHEAEKRLRAATLRPARQREMTRALGQAEHACEQLSTEIRDLELRAKTIGRKRTIAPLMDRHGELTSELDGIGFTPELPADCGDRRADAQMRLRATQTQAERAERAKQRLESELSGVRVDESFLARAADIRAVHEDLPVIRKAAGDRRKREAEREQAQAGLVAAAALAGVPVDEIEALRRSAADRRTLDSSLRTHNELSERRRAAAARIREADKQHEDAKAAVEVAAPARETNRLAAVVNVALKAGPLTQQVAHARAEMESHAKQADVRRQRLFPAPVSVAELRVLPVPSREVISRAAADFERIAREAEALGVDRDRLDREGVEVDEQFERIMLAGAAPTAEALLDARTKRDAHWLDIRTAIDEEKPVAATAADSFERRLGEADSVADARTEGAATIEKFAQVEARRRRLAAERVELDRREQAVCDRRSTAESFWEQSWQRTGMTAIEPPDALVWLDERDRILALDETATSAERSVSTLTESQERHIADLRARLTELDVTAPSGAGLDELIVLAQSVIDDAQRESNTLASVEAAVIQCARELASSENERDLADAAFQEWQRSWTQLRREAGLPAAATPEVAHEIIRAVNDGLGHLARIADLDRRIAGIDRDGRDFEVRVAELCETLAPDLEDTVAERAAAALHARMEEAATKLARRENLAEQLSTASHELEAIDEERRLAQAELDDLLHAAAVTSINDLCAAESRASRVQVLREEIAAVERHVAEVGEGRFADLAVEAAGFDRPAAALEIQEIGEKVEDLRVVRDDRKEELGQRKSELAEAERDTAAVEAAQDVELARARVEEVAVEHAKAKLSAAIIRRAVERYRRLHQDPLLTRANELFGRFTLGSFAELFVDIDDKGNAVLIGRQRDRVLKRVPEMSTGTREQLFLALRIAAIERYVATSGPVPVVFDDVFLESDEPRSMRIFEALGELAKQTQVIVLTHHHHLIGLGEAVLGDALVVTRLPDVAASLRPAVTNGGTITRAA